MSTLPHRPVTWRVNGETRATEIAELLARLATLMPEQPPDTEALLPKALPARVLLTVEEAAERLHIGKTKTYALIKAGEIESVLIGRLRRIHIDAVNAYAARLTRQQATAHRAA